MPEGMDAKYPSVIRVVTDDGKVLSYRRPDVPGEGEKTTVDCGPEEVLPGKSASGRTRIENYAKKYVGRSKVMPNGLVARVTAYRGIRDLEVTLSNGTVFTGVDARSFESFDRRPECHLGEKRMMNCGIEGEIIAFKNSQDISVRFTTGHVRNHTTYALFKEGSLLPVKTPSHLPEDEKREERKGEVRKMHCGQMAAVMEYRTKDSVDLLFESRASRKNVSYSYFRSGAVEPWVLRERERWSDKELKVLEDNKGVGNEEISKMLPLRTPDAVRAKRGSIKAAKRDEERRKELCK